MAKFHPKMISCISPSVRLEGLEIVKKCLKRQDYQDFEWIVASPFEYKDCDLWLKDPPKKKGDFWVLCKAWNNAYAHAKGELIVNIQDLIWFPPDTLSKFARHYQANSKALVTAVGHHYSKLDEIGVPEGLVWQDPRLRKDLGTFYEVEPSEMEMSLCSIPKQALIDCGGIDEAYDKVNAAQEKEMCWRLDKLGYKFFIDQTLEYRALQHPRLSEDWDKIYSDKTGPLFSKHMWELKWEKRTLNVHCLEKYIP